MEVAEELTGLLDRTRVGQPFPLAGLTLVPLLAEDDGQDAVLLEEGLEAGTARVAELESGARVGQVEVTYSGPGLLLLVDGEELVGAKQDRVVNTSFVVPNGPPAIIPVSCVEQGRWRYKSAVFKSSGRILSSKARYRKMARVYRSVAVGGSYDADQSAVWTDVDEYINRSGVHSSTMAFSDAAEARSPDLEQRLEKLEPLPDQRGLAAVHGGRVVALDLFSSPALYRRAWRKVARGLLLEDYPQPPAAPTDPTDPRQLVQQSLASALTAPVTRQAAPGAGQTLHGEHRGMLLSAVVHQGNVYHAFAAANEAG
jgi:hypothetical protein